MMFSCMNGTGKSSYWSSHEPLWIQARPHGEDLASRQALPRSSPQSVATRISGSPPRAVAVHPSLVSPPVVAYPQVAHPVTQVVTYPPVSMVSQQQVNYPVVSQSQVSYAPAAVQQPMSYSPAAGPTQVSYAPVVGQLPVSYAPVAAPVSYAPVASPTQVSYAPVVSQSMPRPSYGSQPLTTSVQSLGSFTPPLPMWTPSSPGRAGRA